MKNNYHNKHSQSGFSVVELLVASVIGLLILTGAVTVFSSNNSSSALSNGMSRVQESGRIAMDIIANDIRMAGYQGCADSSMVSINAIANAGPTINMPATAITGAEVGASGWNPSVPIDLTGLNAPLAGTDVIYVQHGSGRTTQLQTSMANPTQNIISLARNPDQLAAGDLVMVSDCTSVDVFRAGSVGTTTTNVSLQISSSLNSQANLSKAYQISGNALADPMRIMRYEATAYYIANTTRTDSRGLPIRSLFAQDLSTVSGTSLELVEGVENMQFLYGEALANGDIRYVPAGTAGLDMSQVVSVQFGLLVNSIDLITSRTDDRLYQVADELIGDTGTTITHSSGKVLRTAFNTTVRLRNRSN